MAEQKPKLPARIHPGERAKMDALNAMARTFHGAPQEKSPVSYYTPELIQCTLPHSEPKGPTWVRTNGDFTLILASGVDKSGDFIGLPYGSFPRLVLAHIITRVIQTGERRIELSSCFIKFLEQVGYTANLNTRHSKSISDKLQRLLRASITFEYSTGNAKRGALAVQDVKIAPKFALWWDYKQPDQGSFFESYIEISDEFRQAILRAPVPLHTEILAALKKSPLALDLYMWVSYRLFTMQATGQEQLTLSYSSLREQFGSGMGEGNYRLFRFRLKEEFAKVAKYWQTPGGGTALLNYELHEDGLTLYRSPLLIPIAKRQAALKAADEEAQRILTSRQFDTEMMKKARQIAGTWDIRWLAAQYFEWVEKKGIAPKDPRAHFLRFIKAHRKRNGETV